MIVHSLCDPYALNLIHSKKDYSMKYILLAALVSFPVFAQIPVAVKDFAKQALEACKEDKSKITGCESYTEIKPLKECLMKNTEKLSMKCKMALKLVK